MMMSALEEVLKDAEEQYGKVGAWAYTVKQAAAELSRLQAIEAAAREADAVLEIAGQVAETSVGKFSGPAKDFFYDLAKEIRLARSKLAALRNP